MKKNEMFIIREAIVEDGQKLIDLNRMTMTESEHHGLEIDEYNMTIERQEKTIEMYGKADNAILLVAIYNDDIVGSLSFRGGSFNKFKHVGELGVYVLKKYWGMGIGTALISKLIEWAKESNVIKKISLRVRVDNKNAIKLYEKLGFKKEGVLTNEFNCNGILYDLIYMGMQID